jgi:hypothetical protein
MEPDGWPLDGAVAAERLRNLISDIEDSSDEDRIALLSDLLCVAWVSDAAQNQ